MEWVTDTPCIRNQTLFGEFTKASKSRISKISIAAKYYSLSVTLTDFVKFMTVLWAFFLSCSVILGGLG